MEHDIIMAGFGGQGVLLIGKMLAYAGMKEGKEVSWLPSYGPEMRGGTANCTVVISDRPVGSPVIRSPHSLLAMNLPSLDKFEPSVKPGGCIVVNTSLINRDVQRADVKVVKVATNEVALALGNARASNIVALGAFVGATDVVSMEQVEALVRETFAAKPKAIELNIAAVRKGFSIGRGE
jgi:2-oxoglutarate ferredoxin oxidoreductase subunit gamma